MTVPSDPDTFIVTHPVSPEMLAALKAGVAAACAAGAGSVWIDLDGAGFLDSAAIGSLIAMLRDARERGGSIVLIATREEILETLRITALDKVFLVVAARDAVHPDPGSPRRTSRTGTGSGLVAAFFALAAVLVARPGVATDLTVADVVRDVASQNAAMRTYEADVKVDIALRSFPYLSQHLSGTSYFERPDNYEIVFTSVPSIAKGFDKLYTDVGDVAKWPRRFDMTLVGQESYAGHRDLVVRLVQKVRGMIDHEDVRIDPASWHIDEMEWHYYNGGEIAMSQEYVNVGGFSVLSKQHATIRIPFVHAAADAVYDDYRTNVAIDDGVFTPKKY